MSKPLLRFLSYEGLETFVLRGQQIHQERSGSQISAKRFIAGLQMITGEYLTHSLCSAYHCLSVLSERGLAAHEKRMWACCGTYVGEGKTSKEMCRAQWQRLVRRASA